jgi:hypothetical protein
MTGIAIMLAVSLFFNLRALNLTRQRADMWMNLAVNSGSFSNSGYPPGFVGCVNNTDSLVTLIVEGQDIIIPAGVEWQHMETHDD